MGEVWIEQHHEAGKARDLYGIQVDTCARVQSLGESDQILLTRFPFDVARQALKGEELKDIGTLSWLNHGSCSRSVQAAPESSQDAGFFETEVSGPVLLG